TTPAQSQAGPPAPAGRKPLGSRPGIRAPCPGTVRRNPPCPSPNSKLCLQRRTSPAVPAPPNRSSLSLALVQPVLDLGEFIEAGLNLLVQNPFFGGFCLFRPQAGLLGPVSQ